MGMIMIVVCMVMVIVRMIVIMWLMTMVIIVMVMVIMVMIMCMMGRCHGCGSFHSFLVPGLKIRNRDFGVAVASAGFAHQTTSNSMLLMLSSWPAHTAAVLHHQGARRTARMEMQGTREQFFAGPGFPLDQDRQIGARRLAGETAEFGHCLARIKEAFEMRGFALHLGIRPAMQKMRILADLEFADETTMAPRELARLQCPLDDEAGLFGQQRLGEILIGGGARERVAQFDIRFLADEENPHEVWMGETQPCQKLDDVAVTIFDIGEDEIDMRIFEDVNGLRVMRGHEDAIVGTVHQSIRSGFALLTGICNKQDARLDAHLACRLPTDFVVRVRPEFANLLCTK
jgi:hypothetical protein